VKINKVVIIQLLN